MDDDIADYIRLFIQDHGVKTIVEVAGNNGNFGSKVLSAVDDQDLSYTIVDSVELQVSDQRITHVNAFVEAQNDGLFKDFNPDLVIIRHALAHNKSLVEFFRNIVKFFSPKYIYVENASLERTLEKADFSQFYSEHFYHLTAFSVSKLASAFDYSTIDSVVFDIHNGSFGVVLSSEVSAPVLQSPQIESDTLKGAISKWIYDVEDFWRGVAATNMPVVIWGSSAKFLFTFSALNLGDICSVAVVVDSTPEKAGLFAPGMSVPVTHESKFVSWSGKYVFVVGARNFYKHIQTKILGRDPEARVECPPF